MGLGVGGVKEAESSGVGPGFCLRSLCSWWDHLLSAGTQWACHVLLVSIILNILIQNAFFFDYLLV